jgi:serine/threonine protein kinase
MSAYPETIGKYRIVSVLGQGAMGTVFKGGDTGIDGNMAIKTVARGGTEHEQQQLAKRFRREVQAAGRLTHQKQRSKLNPKPLLPVNQTAQSQQAPQAPNEVVTAVPDKPVQSPAPNRRTEPQPRRYFNTSLAPRVTHLLVAAFLCVRRNPHAVGRRLTHCLLRSLINPVHDRIVTLPRRIIERRGLIKL